MSGLRCWYMFWQLRRMLGPPQNHMGITWHWQAFRFFVLHRQPEFPSNWKGDL